MSLVPVAAAAEFLGELQADLRSQGVDLRIAGANEEVVRILEATDEGESGTYARTRHRIGHRTVATGAERVMTPEVPRV